MKNFMNKLKKIEGVVFANVVKALAGGFHNIPSYECREGGELDLFLSQHNLKKEEVVLLANHSFGGRNFEVEDGVKTLFSYDDHCFDGRWYVLTQGNCKEIYCISTRSSSTIIAKKQKDGNWTVTLSVPVIDGMPYKGHYWNTFHSALGVIDQSPEE